MLNPLRLDHVAVRVRDRAATEGWLADELGLRVIERNERLSLLGVDATAGKITLFDRPDADEGPPRRLVGITLCSSTPRDPLATDDGFVITFADHPSAPEMALTGLTVRSADPPAAAAAFATTFGFSVAAAHRNVAVVSVGNERITLVREQIDELRPEVLDHVGMLVDSADQQIDCARRNGLRILDIVDAANTRAVFIEGPDELRLEYVEHKPEFALA